MSRKKDGTSVESMAVFDWVSKSKNGYFTSAEVSQHFGITRQQAAANIAILRIKDLVEPSDPPKTRTGVSRWQVKGKGKKKK